MNAGEVPTPEIHALLVTQVERYSDGDAPLLTSFGREQSRYSVRYAAVGILGTLGDFIEYELETGVASCSGGVKFSLMEGGVYFRPNEHLRLGLMQGHVMRGFELHEECIAVLAAEKPVFAQTLAPCHPTGAIAEFAFDLRGHMDLKAQIGSFNGEGGSIDNNHDYNVGILFSTPLPGLSLTTYYNDVAIKQGNDPETYEPIYGSAYRAGIGVDYETRSIHLRGEYYFGKGFSNVGGFVIPWEDDPNNWDNDPLNPEYLPNPDLWDYEAHEMRAYFVEGGYRFSTGYKPLHFIQPYCRYQWWDKCVNLTDLNAEHAYITLGLCIGLGAENTFLRVDYENQTTKPSNRIVPDPDGWPEDRPHDSSHDYLSNEASRLIIRLQAGS